MLQAKKMFYAHKNRVMIKLVLTSSRQTTTLNHLQMQNTSLKWTEEGKEKSVEQYGFPMVRSITEGTTVLDTRPGYVSLKYFIMSTCKQVSFPVNALDTQTLVAIVSVKIRCSTQGSWSERTWWWGI